MVLVAAAGNKGAKKPFYPAAYDDYVIAVAATNQNDAKPRFSNYGDWVDIGAPGVNILSTAPDHPNDIWGKSGPQYGTLKGTSMATPHVAGVAGLIWSTNLCDDGNPSTNDNVCVRSRILTKADQIDGLRDDWTDGRRLNANAAVAPPSGP